MLVTKLLLSHLHESLDILTVFVWNSPLIPLSLSLRGPVVTKGREIIIFVKSHPPFDAHQQYLDSCLIDYRLEFLGFALEFFTVLLISRKSRLIIIGFYL